MISKQTLEAISRMFCGDVEGYYSRKSGPNLVGFFNNYFGFSDKYGQGFPSRWAYVYDKLVALIDNRNFDKYLNTILGHEYLMQDLDISKVGAAEQSERIFIEICRLLNRDSYTITRKNGDYHLTKESSDLVLIGEGGYANVYLQKSTGLVVKKLKDDFLTDKGIRSRFKREFNITKSLQDTHGIIEIYTFDENTCSYTMEYYENTLLKYIEAGGISEDIRINCIRQILHIMKEVHCRDIIHRDLSPTNIFILHGMIKIADFGLGKDLNVFTSHQTLHTNAVGQYRYCAPEQFMMLKDGDKKSDVYSIGRVINFLMTGNPGDSHHQFRNVAEKATNSDAGYRFADASQLSTYFEKSIIYYNKAKDLKQIKEKISHGILSEDVEEYVYELTSESLSKAIVSEENGLLDVLIKFMKKSDANAQHIVQSVDGSYFEVCNRSFAAYDPFATFAFKILSEDFSFVVKEIAANILRYVATDVNRFSAQHLVERIKSIGIEPMLEEILDS